MKRVSVTCYLPSHASKILQKYVEQSGYSKSRTIEEIIVAFNHLDKMISNASEHISSELLISTLKIHSNRLKRKEFV